jgi:nucleoside-diphosphate-sugar epimerase
MKTALVIGGSGPTGPHIVEGLRQRGYRVATLNRGVHPVDHPPDVERIFADPHFQEPLVNALGDRTFDLVVATYGRLSVTAQVLAEKTERFIGIGGVAAYRGFMTPSWPMKPAGMIIPTTESAPLVEDQAENRFSALVVAAEHAVMRCHPRGTVFRYPYVYGPRQVVPREWSLVRRVLDGRRTMILFNGGLGLLTHIYAQNAAHAVLLAVDNPTAAAGKVYNCGDDVQFDQKQLLEIGADALGVKVDFVSVPTVLSLQTAAVFSTPEHKLFDTQLIRNDLGYRDLVHPAEAVARTVRWYADHPLERGGEFERRMTDVFDYGTEDRIIALCRAFEAKISALGTKAVDPGHPYPHPKETALARDHRGR